MVKLNHPNYRIPIRSLSKPNDLLRAFKIAKLKNYCYAFYVHVPSHNIDILMNIGMSTGGHIGDRIYRKIGNLPGWGNLALTGDFGSDIKNVVHAVEEKFAHIGLVVHKDNVTLHVWDTSNFVTDSFNNPTIEAEKELIRQYKNQFGNLPVGNFQDPCKRNKVTVSKMLFEELFD